MNIFTARSDAVFSRGTFRGMIEHGLWWQRLLWHSFSEANHKHHRYQSVASACSIKGFTFPE